MATKSKPNKLLEPIVAFTGAGISAESGIPTFRGEQGLWRQYKAQDLATQASFERDPDLVWQFYEWRRQIVTNCEVNPAHMTLVNIERASTEFKIITQNVDGLHLRAGNENVIELHGSLWALKCCICGFKWNDNEVPLPELPPKCRSCMGLARPDVVWFGEMLEHSVLAEAENAARSAKTMLVIGTSALVQPASLLPILARENGAHLIEFNLDPTPLSPHVDESFYGPAGQELPLWWKRNSGKLLGEPTEPG